MGALIAEQYLSNRLILVGDSAHAFPPAGGFYLIENRIWHEYGNSRCSQFGS
jgi:hypothetical protein